MKKSIFSIILMPIVNPYSIVDGVHVRQRRLYSYFAMLSWESRCPDQIAPNSSARDEGKEKGCITTLGKRRCQPGGRKDTACLHMSLEGALAPDCTMQISNDIGFPFAQSSSGQEHLALGAWMPVTLY